MTAFEISEEDRQELVEAFVAETDDVLGELEQLLLGMEETPENDQLLHDFFRGVHTLKGNAACLQFAGLTRFAHVVEELLDGMREGRIETNTTRVSQLLDVVDVFRDLSLRSVAGDDALTSDQEGLLQQLQQWATATGLTVSAPSRASQENGQARKFARSLRVNIDKLDQMLDLISEIATARGEVRQLVEDVAADEKALDAMRELDRLSFDLQEAIMNVRLVPVGPSLRHFHRVVRDVASSQEKRVRLQLEGEDVEVDTTVIEQLKDPITHMIRNAIDHGVELPDRRVLLGKNAQATISVTALHQSGGIIFRISDDGAGLDETRIAERARALGLDPERMTRQELLHLTLQPGFSTARKVTDLSGRGVGMDVVRRNVELLRGTLRIDSQPGRGTTIEIRLPLTVTVIDGFSVAVGGETYIIPIERIVECTEISAGKPGFSGVLDLRGAPLPFLRMRNLFALDSAPPARENVVVVEHENGRAGIVVDQLIGSNQVVMKPMNRFLRHYPAISGSSILGNGRVALILDIPEIIHRATAASLGVAS
jgi:two-component system chemotaxis sensor kinase CheA